MIRRALIVESDPSLGHLLDRILRRTGWDSIRAGAFDEALDAYETGRYGLVLCETELDGDGGLVLAKVLRRCEPFLDIVLTCGTVSGLAQVQAAGFTRFLIKPFVFEELQRLIRGISSARTRELSALDALRHSR